MIEKRFLLFVGIFAIAFSVLIIRLVRLQIENHDFYFQRAIELTEKKEIKKPLRGEIYDRNNILLTSTIQLYRLYFDKSMVDKDDYEKIIDSLGSVLNNIDRDFYLKKIKNSNDNIVYLEEELTSELYHKLQNKLHQLKLSCFGFEEYQRRIYPREGIASHLLGYVRKDSDGVDGIEKYYNEYLKGKEGIIYYRKDAAGRKRGRLPDKGYDPVNGYHLQLTIDLGIQSILEEELTRAVQQWEAKSGIGIAMNPNTGEILGLANFPTFNPSKYNEFSDEVRKNRAIAEIYDPGSTFKAVTLATAIEYQKIDLNSIIDAENGIFKLANGKRIEDDHKFRYLTPRESFIYSSNIVMAKISKMIGEENFYKSIYNFGFGNYTGIDLPGEVRGIVRKPNKKDFDLLWMAHGYSISVTPIQLITMYAAIVNGGYLVRPFVVKKIFDSNNQIILENKPLVVRKVISKSTSDLMKDLMSSVITEGTGKKAQLDDVSCGGKTGTAKKYIQGIGYSEANYISSFIGFFPVENPEYLILVKLDSPKKGYYAAEVAAPIFKKIGDRIWNEKQNELKQIKAFAELNVQKTNDENENLSFPDLTGKTKLSAIHIAKSFNTKIEFRGNGDIVSKQIYDPFNNKIIFFLGSDETNGSNINKVVPNLVGLSLREATTKLKTSGIKFRVDGTGYVVDQSIPPGKTINSGQELKLRCQRGI